MQRVALQGGDDEHGVDESARHPTPDHAEGECARQTCHRQQAPAKRGDALPQFMTDAEARIAHAPERDQRAKQERRSRKHAQRAPHRFDVEYADQRAERAAKQQSD